MVATFTPLGPKVSLRRRSRKRYRLKVGPPFGAANCLNRPMKHLVFLAAVAIYVLIIGQNWGIYTGALLVALYRRYDGRWDSVPFKL